MTKIIKLQEEDLFRIFKRIISERKTENKKGKEGLQSSKSIPKEMKDKIIPYVNSSSTYRNNCVFGLRKPKIKKKHFDQVGFAADKNGFFVYTHRARSKSYETPEKIPQKDITFIESTG